jgi:uncharacterized membrane protein
VLSSPNEKELNIMAKKKNSRKALAVALGIMGIAGLSVASASQLTVNVNDDNIAVGTNTFAAACDDAVDVDYTYLISANTYDELTISGVDTTCATKSLEYTLATSAGDVTAVVTVGALGVVAPIDISTVALTEDLDSIDIAIY